MEVINDMVQSMLYDVDRKFKETHQDYKTDDDEIFIPYKSFKENVAEAMKEALEKHDTWCHPESSLAFHQSDMG